MRNSKHEILNTKQYLNPKPQTLCFEHWNLELGICLGFSALDLEFLISYVK
ncbi:MAG: hypothetical protein HY769_04895 [Candidatus Stahlbacteria bacterium]|nr:hypothetical protein [Candidatus Stahlbacteria bacterium]